MYFLVDLENVKNSGMKGCESLLPEDTVEIFFSEAFPNISHGIFENIKKSGCDIKICKLQNQRKNALDFYITSRIGELIGSGYSGQIAIISHDKDYKSVQEYWRECSDVKRRILLSGTITESIISANQANERTRMLRKQEKMVSIEVEYAKFEESRRIHTLLAEQFSGTEYAEQLAEIEEVYEKRNDKKVLYLDSLKRFGRKNGIQIYNQMKQLIV